MKVIADNKIQVIVASSENSAYPDDNLLDEHPRRRWQAASSSVSSATLTITTKGVCDALGIVGITADSAHVSVSDPNECQFEAGTDFETGTEWATTAADLNISTTWIEGDTYNALWADFDQFNSVVDISVTLNTAAGSADTLAAGVAYAGEKKTFSTPRYGMVISGNDYSIVEELSNGATYTKKGDVVRVLSATLIDGHDDMHELLKLHRVYGPQPLMWSFIDNTTSTGYIMYCRFVTPPSGSFDYPAYGTISAEFIEVI